MHCGAVAEQRRGTQALPQGSGSEAPALWQGVPALHADAIDNCLRARSTAVATDLLIERYLLKDNLILDDAALTICYDVLGCLDGHRCFLCFVMFHSIPLTCNDTQELL